MGTFQTFIVTADVSKIAKTPQWPWTQRFQVKQKRCNIYIYICLLCVNTCCEGHVVFLNQPESTTPVFDLHGTYPEH